VKIKQLLYKHAEWLLTLAFGVAVFLFWRYRYPFALTYQEQFQLFLFDGEYLMERLREPGGVARYVAEFLVQFYNHVTLGAVILALLLMLVQQLTWLLMKSCSHTSPLTSHYAFSFIPSVMLWYSLGDESVLLTYVVALVMALGMMVVWTKKMKGGRIVQGVAALVVIPIAYWLTGPMVLLVALWVFPLSIIYALALILLSAHFLPFPTMRVMCGISYYRFPVTLPYLLMVIPVVTYVIVRFAHRIPKAKSWVSVAEVVVLIGLVGFVDKGFNAKKYELLEYDYLVRLNDWRSIIAKAEKHAPDLPMSVGATNLALAMTNQLGERAFDFFQRGREGLLPRFERNFTTAQLTGEIYFHLGLINTAQRFAFESMEALPNYNKSARSVKRLAETNLINGQYEVARKYLKMLQKTIFYRPWAQRMMALLGDEKAIDEHPLYGWLRKARIQDDFLFSEDELDKICGQLFLHNQQNQMAVQYLLMAPLLDKNIQNFMTYAQVVQSSINYNPRACQEAIAFAFMQQRQQPPQGVVSPMVLQRMNEFARVYSGSKSSPELMRFKNTVWYYLTAGK
jgi:hypothetical protein